METKQHHQQTDSQQHPESSLRFIRLNPRFDRQETLDLLQSEIKATYLDGRYYPIQVPWLLSETHGLEFFAVPGDFCLKKSPSFQSGMVYGMDITSGAAVAALLLDIYDCDASVKKYYKDFDSKHQLRVLDLCCAPGLKLCMIADLIPTNSSVVGVDVSKSRLSLCKNIIQKYHIDSGVRVPDKKYNTKERIESLLQRNSQCRVNIRLYHGDGTTFGAAAPSMCSELTFDSSLALEEQVTRGKRKKMNKSARAREKRRLLELSIQDKNTCKKVTTDVEAVDLPVRLFDRVLVDAECSSDGAIRHIQKRQLSTISRDAIWNDTNMHQLVDLQQHLIESGFRLLENGGILVYSTCSFSQRQNEDIVEWLLKKYKHAVIIPVSFSQQNASNCATSKLDFMKEGTIPGTVRFMPTSIEKSTFDAAFPGGGFFLAKICKMHQ